MAPTQVAIATIVSDADDYARQIAARLAAAGIRAELDLRNEKIGYKVREHTLAKTPWLWALGRREAEQGTVAIRRLAGDDQRTLALDDAIATLVDEAKVPSA